MPEINIITEIDEIKKVISYSKRIGFFFGAGSSCAFGLPNVNVLTNEVEGKLTDALYDSFVAVKGILQDLHPNDNISIEDILNYIRQIRDITSEREDKFFEGLSGKMAKELDETICEQIFLIIKSYEENADISELRRFFAWLDMIDRTYSKEIFTTNYDMLLEKAMEANYIPYFDGFVGSYEPFFWSESIDKFVGANDMTSSWIRLWKIHGSLNWKCIQDKYRSMGKIVRTAKMDNPENELLIYPSKEKYNLSRKQPFIAYFDRLKKYLLQGELFFIFSGYSFSDQHINDIIFNCLRQNPRLYALVLCFSDDQVDNMKEYAESYLNLCVMGPKKVIMNGNLFNWIYDDSNGDSNDSDLYWDESKKELTLGDFNKLIDFLVINSGKKSTIEEVLNAK